MKSVAALAAFTVMAGCVWAAAGAALVAGVIRHAVKDQAPEDTYGAPDCRMTRCSSN